MRVSRERGRGRMTADRHATEAILAFAAVVSINMSFPPGRSGVGRSPSPLGLRQVSSLLTSC